MVKGAAGQWKHRSQDGRAIDVEIHFHDINYDSHTARLAIAQDVTERNRLEIELRHSQKLEAVGSLAAGIAHEINTPVQFVGDNLRFLRDAYTDLNKVREKYQRLREAAAADGEAEKRLAEEVSEIEKAVDVDYLMAEIPKAIDQSLDGVTRVATLVRAMKEFAHPEAKEKANADLNEALRSTLIVARNELKYVANVETDLGSIPALICNIGELNQVFLNLLVNAAHAIAEAKKADRAKRSDRSSKLDCGTMRCEFLFQTPDAESRKIFAKRSLIHSSPPKRSGEGPARAWPLPARLWSKCMVGP